MQSWGSIPWQSEAALHDFPFAAAAGATDPASMLKAIMAANASELTPAKSFDTESSLC
jgi:hypothetical protein